MTTQFQISTFEPGTLCVLKIVITLYVSSHKSELRDIQFCYYYLEAISLIQTI